MIGRIKKKLGMGVSNKKRDEETTQPALSCSTDNVIAASSVDKSIDVNLSKSCNDVDHVEDRVGPYKIKKILFEGNTTVYLATHISYKGKGSTVILKRQDLLSPRDCKYMSKARNELMILRELNDEIYRYEEGHEYIVRLVDEIPLLSLNEHYLVMEYCECGNLLDHLNTLTKPYPIQILRRLIMDILLGVKFMHSLGIAHKDIKLENILLQHNNKRIVCKVADFGMSVMMRPGFKDSNTDCTPRVIAPEIIRSVEDLDGTTYNDPFVVDMWSVGVVVYAMTELEFPFHPDPPRTLHEANLRERASVNGCMTAMETTTLFENTRLNLRRPREMFMDDIHLHYFINGLLEYNEYNRFTVERALLHSFMHQDMRILKKFEFLVLNKPDMEDFNAIDLLTAMYDD